MSTGGIVGVAVGGAVALLLVVFLACVLMAARLRRKAKEEHAKELDATIARGRGVGSTGSPLHFGDSRNASSEGMTPISPMSPVSYGSPVSGPASPRSPAFQGIQMAHRGGSYEV